MLAIQPNKINLTCSDQVGLGLDKSSRKQVLGLVRRKRGICSVLEWVWHGHETVGQESIWSEVSNTITFPKLSLGQCYVYRWIYIYKHVLKYQQSQLIYSFIRLTWTFSSHDYNSRSFIFSYEVFDAEQEGSCHLDMNGMVWKGDIISIQWLDMY